MRTLSDHDLAALHPFISRVTSKAILLTAVLGFAVVACCVAVIAGSLTVILLVLASELAGATILFGSFYLWCALDEASARASRELSRANASHSHSRAVPVEPRRRLAWQTRPAAGLTHTPSPPRLR